MSDPSADPSEIGFRALFIESSDADAFEKWAQTAVFRPQEIMPHALSGWRDKDHVYWAWLMQAVADYKPWLAGQLRVEEP